MYVKCGCLSTAQKKLVEKYALDENKYPKGIQIFDEEY
jgi:hypothetical protein